MDRSEENTVELQNEIAGSDLKALWVFAYGSLCWKPGFEFNKAIAGSVRGYKRRFWQGNTTHRGTEEKPGRVATLVEDSEGIVHGIAFAVSGEAAIPYLSKRECEMGGYITQFTTFYSTHFSESFQVLLYIATPKNPLWMGENKLEEIAKQIADCTGDSGHNVEYVVRLANFMREHFPSECDNHLYRLEKEILTIVEQSKMCMKAIMGNGEGCVKFVKRTIANRHQPNRPEQEPERIESFEHTTRVQEKQLRCLNI